MNFRFSDNEIKGKATEILAHGDLEKIAERTGKSATIYSNMYNVNDERESNLHKAAQEIAALMDVSPERGCELLNLFVALVSRHKSAENLCSVNETRKARKEFSDIIDARLEGKSPNDQIIEVVQTIDQLEVLKSSLISELNKEEIQEKYFS